MAKKCHNYRLQANPWYREEGTQSRHNPIFYSTIYNIFQVLFPFNANKLFSDKTKICLDIGPAY